MRILYSINLSESQVKDMISPQIQKWIFTFITPLSLTFSMTCGRCFDSLLFGPPSTGFRSASRLYLRRAPHRRQVAQHFDLSAPDLQPAEVRPKRTAVYSGSSGCEIAIYWLAPD
jgi:hypothetical protein